MDNSIGHFFLQPFSSPGPTVFLDPPVGQERYINRDLSWLAFNERVLEEVVNQRNPLLERVRFLAIAANNLDEFYMVHVAGLRRQIEAGIVLPLADGSTPAQALAAIDHRAQTMLGGMHDTWRALHADLRSEGISVVAVDELGPEDHAYLRNLFDRDIFPLLTPLAISPTHPFPFIPNRGLAVAVKLQSDRPPHDIQGIVRVPSQTARFVTLPGATSRFVAIEDIIQLYLAHLFPGFGILGSGAFRVVRDSDLDVEDLEVGDDAEHLLLSFETALQRRSHGEVVGLSASSSIPEDLFAFLVEHLHVPRQAASMSQGPVGLASLGELVLGSRPELLFTPFTARYPGRMRDFGGDCFSAIQSEDLLVHHPYESFDVVVQFIRQAAADPAVVAIKQTLYRTSADSPIVQALIEAAHAGKSVTVVVELKARFDEEANLKWARDLERAGAQVTYGFLELKIHAKLSLVVRRESAGLVSYIHYGTGNYNPLTARVYTDLSLFSCDIALCTDAARLFNYMTGYAQPESLEKISAAPIQLRAKLLELIEAEIAFAQAGRPAAIWFKINALVDPEMIEALYRASAAGVHIRGIVRGMCALRAQVPGLSDNIRIHSIVGRFLEHSRIVCFGNGADLPSALARVFISSADWMPRNLDRRIETLIPVESEAARRQVMEQIMVASLKDDTQAWHLRADNRWERLHSGRSPFSAHDYFMANPSLSGRGNAPSDTGAPNRLKLPRK